MTAGPATGTACDITKKIPVPMVAPTPIIVSWNNPMDLRSSPPPVSAPVSSSITLAGLRRKDRFMIVAMSKLLDVRTPTDPRVPEQRGRPCPFPAPIVVSTAKHWSVTAAHHPDPHPGRVMLPPAPYRRVADTLRRPVWESTSGSFDHSLLGRSSGSARTDRSCAPDPGRTPRPPKRRDRLGGLV